MNFSIFSASNQEPLISIEDHEQKQAKLDFPDINCDKPLHPKLSKLHLYNNMNTHFCAGFFGVPGSGKTSHLEALFRTPEYFNQVWHKIYLVMPQSSMESIDHSVFQYLDRSQIYHELNLKNLKEIVDKAYFNKHRDPPQNTCVIFDDVQADFKGECKKLLCQTMANRRHCHLSIFILAQNYMLVPLNVRKLLSDLFCFNMAASEFENVYKEHGKFSRKVWKQMLAYYLQRTKEEEEKSKQGKEFDKVFLYLNIPSREAFVNMEQINFENEDEFAQMLQSFQQGGKRKIKYNEEEDEHISKKQAVYKESTSTN